MFKQLQIICSKVSWIANPAESMKKSKGIKKSPLGTFKNDRNFRNSVTTQAHSGLVRLRNLKALRNSVTIQSGRGLRHIKIKSIIRLFLHVS